MGIHFRIGWHFVDGVLAVQQIVPARNDEQLSGSLCGKVGPLQGIAPSAGTVLAFNMWLVRTSGLEWILLALVIRLAFRLGSRSGK